MQNFTWEKMKPLVWQLLLLLMIGGIAWFGIRWLAETITVKKNDIQKLLVTREQREKQLERLPDLEAQHNLVKEEGDRLDIILRKDRLVEFIEVLERLATQEKVEIKIESRDNAFLESKVTPAEKTGVNSKQPKAASSEPVVEEGEATSKKGNPATKETGIVADLPFKKYLKLTITLTGKYEDLVRYLHRLESLPYALDVISLNLREKPESPDRVAIVNDMVNPFGQPTAPPAPPVQSITILEGIFETAVYIQD